MKKTVKSLLALLSAITLSSCNLFSAFSGGSGEGGSGGESGEHTHVASTTYGFDEDTHFYYCTICAQEVKEGQELLRLRGLSRLQLHDMECPYFRTLSSVWQDPIYEGRKIRKACL